MTIAATIANGPDIIIEDLGPRVALYRATLAGHGGAAAIGYGTDEARARADLAATVDFNLTHNGRAIA
jgi:hypothetical protein